MSDLIQSALAATLLAIDLGMEAAAQAAAPAPTAAPATPGLPTAVTGGALPLKQEAGLSVTINDTALAPADLEVISEVIVKQDVEEPSSFSLRFDGDDALARADDARYNLGGKVTVSVGYGTLTPLITGEITGLEIDMAGGEVPTLMVRGYDRRHRLLRGTRTDAYAQATDSAIAEKIAQRNGLDFGGQETTVEYELVLQHEQTDLDFLKQRAGRIGYEVVVDDETLFFRPHMLGAPAALTLSMDGDVTELYARMSALYQPSEVHVRGWDPKQKQAIDEMADTTALASMGGKAGAKVVADAFVTVKGVVTRVDQPVFKVDEAKAMARGQFEDTALGFVSGEGTCIGNAALSAGTTITLAALGARFGGKYYVVSTEHVYTREQGYRTRFMVRRNATGIQGTSITLPGGA